MKYMKYGEFIAIQYGKIFRMHNGEEIFDIDPDLCTECVGHYDSPECQAICPVDCIIPDPSYDESRSELKEKYKKLTGNKD